ncbi:MAG TPA: hypothetical protein VEY09_04520 [Pyrinomonadaceae bacterium]|nr:hypothetical protein [Pyrinomonadaceae bacterium]
MTKPFNGIRNLALLRSKMTDDGGAEVVSEIIRETLERPVEPLRPAHVPAISEVRRPNFTVRDEIKLVHTPDRNPRREVAELNKKIFGKLRELGALADKLPEDCDYHTFQVLLDRVMEPWRDLHRFTKEHIFDLGEISRRATPSSTQGTKRPMGWRLR